LYVLAIVAGGAMAMTYETVQIRYGIKELAPRLVFGFIAGNFSLWWTSMILDFTNSLTQALTAQPIAGPGALDSIRTRCGPPCRTPPPRSWPSWSRSSS
jgi:hypothetical protein